MAAGGGKRSLPSYPIGITTVAYPPNDFWDPGAGAPAAAYGAPSANTVLNSFHPGGINVLMTDGAVPFISEMIDLETLRRLCVRNDGLEVTF